MAVIGGRPYASPRTIQVQEYSRYYKYFERVLSMLWVFYCHTGLYDNTSAASAAWFSYNNF